MCVWGRTYRLLNNTYRPTSSIICNMYIMHSVRQIVQEYYLNNVRTYIVIFYVIHSNFNISQLVLFCIENGCILILWVIWRPALGSGGSWTPGASLSVWEYRFRLLGNGFKIKSVTPYFSQSEKGTQPRGGGTFSTSPMEGTGGIMKEEKKEVPRLKGKEFKFFPFFYRGGGVSPVRAAGDRGLVSSLTQRDSSGQEKGKIGS